tara:strand:- start:90 stop:605 length:516 start_codon:yes stop_codon:yes gene_type:complete
MLYLSTILTILAATSVTSLPLNINLGAFSPALVVGDGGISFGGEAEASNIMTTLGGASQEAATGSVEKVEKRDLAGFNTALAFATGALRNGPKVELGTGEGGSGGGIIVGPAAGTAAAKRVVGSLPAVTKVVIPGRIAQTFETMTTWQASASIFELWILDAFTKRNTLISL